MDDGLLGHGHLLGSHPPRLGVYLELVYLGLVLQINVRRVGLRRIVDHGSFLVLAFFGDGGLFLLFLQFGEGLLGEGHEGQLLVGLVEVLLLVCYRHLGLELELRILNRRRLVAVADYTTAIVFIITFVALVIRLTVNLWSMHKLGELTPFSNRAG